MFRLLRELDEVVSDAYCFANAAAIWSDVARGCMHKSGFERPSLDVMTFLWYDKDGAVKAVATIHVADLLVQWFPFCDL